MIEHYTKVVSLQLLILKQLGRVPIYEKLNIKTMLVVIKVIMVNNLTVFLLNNETKFQNTLQVLFANVLPTTRLKREGYKAKLLKTLKSS